MEKKGFQSKTGEQQGIMQKFFFFETLECANFVLFFEIKENENPKKRFEQT